MLDDARMMGVDVSVPSNSVDDVIAARIREKYYPKKEQATATHRARLIKHPPATSTPPVGAAGAVETETPPPSAAFVETSEVQPAAPPTPVQLQTGTPTAPEAATRVVVLKPIVPPVVAPAPPEPEEVAKVTPVELSEPEPEVLQPVVEAVAPTPVPVVEPPALRISKLTPPPPEEAPVAAQVTTIKQIQVPPPAPPAAPVEPPAATPPARVDQPAPPPGGTVVRKLTPPPRPMPAPPPQVSTRTRPTGPGGPASPGGQPGPGGRFDRSAPPRDGRDTRDAGRDQGRNVHILPSGAQQVKVYIPPKDQRPQGRHQKRKEQEGQQKQMPKRHGGAPVHHASPAAPVVPVELKPIRLIEGSTVREFAEKIQAKPRDLVTQLMLRGVMASINQTIKPEIAVEIGREYGWDVSFGDFEDMVIESEFEITPEAMEDTDLRAPIITVMGHVDHGKTSLLDGIRSARVAEGEAGGITQHIGAYSVEVPNHDNPSELRRVVFLDTPGHEAFTLMRARGARVTDIVVLVVAADDGVMPQTVEAIEHARAAGVPIIVAINKIDKPDANPERVKKELADRGLLWTGWSGDTEMVEVSAKKRQNIDGLLEMILLTADIIELKANPTRRATGTVLEAKLDRGRGAVATVLVQNGTLRIGDPFIVGNFYGKVRALMNDRGERVDEVGPAMPVEVLGLEGVPSAGDQFQVVDEISKAQQISSYRQTHARAAALARSAARGLDQLRTQLEAGRVRELLVILKTDVQGSVEVLKDTLTKLSTDKVKVRIIRSDVGAITESDVLLASASQATESGAVTVIIGFNVRPETRAEEVAKQESVDIRLHSIIYKV
ncbi:MAG: translation initiation factor IF-2, partial [Acidobacteriota bacterium]